MPLESNGVGINSRRLHAESVVSVFQQPTYTDPKKKVPRFRLFLILLAECRFSNRLSANQMHDLNSLIGPSPTVES